MSGFNFWATEITYLKKVGPKRAALLKKEAKISTYGDLLHYFPFKYVDKSKITRIRDIRMDQPFVTLIGKITDFELIPGKKGNRLTANFSDGTGKVDLTWFTAIAWVRENFKVGAELVVFGSPRLFGKSTSITHPEIEKKADAEKKANTLSIVPYYHSGEKLKKGGLDSKGIRTLMFSLIEAGQQDLRESLPKHLLTKYTLISRREAYTEIHFPTSFEKLAEAQKRLKFEELFFFQLMLARRRYVEFPKRPSFPFTKVGEYFNTFYKEHIPFELTGAQKRVIKEVRKDMGKATQMNRLVQGDVGSGKTMVAFMSILLALDNGFQAALMAPTEILAGQHYQKMKAYGDPLGIKVGMLTGSVKGAARKQLFKELQMGVIQILVGTHALIEDAVKFARLGLAIVDEQHKFGVMQRARLWQKAERFPHNMLMTATPIPRTLALTMYGDVEVSVIDEMPPGRTPVRTVVRGEPQRLEVFGFIKRELDKGRQAYIVYPLVEESAKLDYLAVTEGHESISRTFPQPQYQVGIVHGRMKPQDKDWEMARFKRGEAQILVSTTVIEVGVDVPNATIMVIENSEKFGLSQLHQLRGRVGRGGGQSFCILMVGKKCSATAKKRLKAMAAIHDGFRISEIDLKLRGPGDFTGVRQSGMPEFKIADIIEDNPLLLEAREAADLIMTHDPQLELPHHRGLKEHFEKYRRAQMLLAGFA